MYLIRKFILKAQSNQFFQDSFWALLGNVLAKGMALVGAMVVARFLGKEVYGEYGTIRSTLMNIAIFSTFGLGYTATKYIAQCKKDRPEFLKTIAFYTMKISLVVSGTMAIALFFLAEYVAVILLEASHLTTPLRFVAVWVIFNSLTTAQIGILAGFSAFKPMARISMYIGFFAFSSSVLLTYFWNLNGALLALLFTQILNWYLNYREVQKHIPKDGTISKDKSFLKELLNFSFPVALQEALYSLTSWLMILILIKLSNYGEVGLYSAAMQWGAILLFIPGILRNVILTHLSGISNDSKKHDRVLKQTLLINFSATFIPFIIIYILKDWIVGFYGTSFKNGLEDILSISLFTVIFVSLSNVYAQAYLSKSKNWLMFGFRFFRDLSILLITIFLIRNTILVGAKALVLSSLINQIVFLFLISIIYHKILNAKKT
ncbi:hypothetical protein DHD80_05060 [Gramella sp. AN32]|nr:hypothetical protein [Gramella sp. AN32]